MARTTRRTALRLAVAASLPLFAISCAHTPAYPQRPIRLMVGFAPGGPNDILGRLVADWLTQRLGQPVLVENLAGASGNRATEVVAKAPPDGHTLLLIGPANAIGLSLAPSPNFDFVRDIRPVVGITREPLAMVVHPSLPVRTVSEFTAYAKARPGQLRMASTGNGSAPHLSGMQYVMMTGVDLAITHYAGGGPALKEMIAGQAQMMFEPMSAAIEPVRSGQLRALAVTTTTRSTRFPDLPTMAESLPGYEASAVTGLGVPRGTPQAIVDRLNREVNAAFADASMKAKFDESGGEAVPGSPAAFEAVFRQEIDRWGRVVRFLGAKRP